MFSRLPIDYRAALCHTGAMFRSSRKFVAVLMLLWLPLFSGSALAATVRMQMGHGNCHEAVAAPAMEHCDMNMGGHHQHHGSMPAKADPHNPSCDTCSVCHLVGTGYLAAPALVPAMQTAARELTPFLVAFHSFTSAPLVPPPLARA